MLKNESPKLRRRSVRTYGIVHDGTVRSPGQTPHVYSYGVRIKN